MWQLIKDILMVLARWFAKREQPQEPAPTPQETQEAVDEVPDKTDAELSDSAESLGLVVRSDGSGGASEPGDTFRGIDSQRTSGKAKHKSD